MRTAIATCLGLMTAVFTNYATQFGPTWTRNGLLVWPLMTTLAILTVGAAVLAYGDTPKKRERLAEIRKHSLHRPPIDAPVRGRDDQLDGLRALVRRPSGRFVVICGPGGVGKTTLAVKLAAEAKGDVWWVRYSDPKSFEDQMYDIANEVGATHRPGGSITDSLWEALQKRRRGWLLVMDNIDEPQLTCPNDEPLAQYRGWIRGGATHGLLLITSRLTDKNAWGPEATLYPLAPLSVSEAARVLRDAVPNAGDDEAAEALAARLGRFPLALRAAGRALAQPTARYTTFDAYRTALDKELGDILAAPHEGNITEAQRRDLLRYTWEVSLDQLVNEGLPLARSLLRMLSLTADVPFPRDLISPKLLKPVVAGKVARSSVDRALDGLHRHGLVGIEHFSIPCVTMHPMIREINALLLTDEGKSAQWLEALDEILMIEAEHIQMHCTWDRGHLLAPHLIPMLKRSSNKRSSKSSAQKIVRNLARSLQYNQPSSHAQQLERAVDDATHSIHSPTPKKGIAGK